jgi:hypothetical protein
MFCIFKKEKISRQHCKKIENLFRGMPEKLLRRGRRGLIVSIILLEASTLDFLVYILIQHDMGGLKMVIVVSN